MNPTRYREEALKLESSINDLHTVRMVDAIRTLLDFAIIATGVDILKRACYYKVKPDANKKAEGLARVKALADKLDAANLPESFATNPVCYRLVHGIIGKATEAGEMVEALLVAIADNKPIDPDNAFEELGDGSWYDNLTMDALEKLEGKGRFTHENIFAGNIAKLRKRYPVSPNESGGERDLAGERTAMLEVVVDDSKVFFVDVPAGTHPPTGIVDGNEFLLPAPVGGWADNCVFSIGTVRSSAVNRICDALIATHIFGDDEHGMAEQLAIVICDGGVEGVEVTGQRQSAKMIWSELVAPDAIGTNMDIVPVIVPGYDLWGSGDEQVVITPTCPAAEPEYKRDGDQVFHFGWQNPINFESGMPNVELISEQAIPPASEIGHAPA